MKLAVAAVLLCAPALWAVDDNTRRLEDAASVFAEVMGTPDRAIPQELLGKAHCIVIVPGMKSAAFVFGGKYGKGYLLCRAKSGAGWSAPAAVRIEGGSFGLQLGGSSTDVILLVMNARGADKLLASKFTIGGEGTAAAGPVGRSATAQTDAQLKAEILSWSRSQGLFAGVSVSGSTLRQDLDDNRKLYGKRVTNRDIINGAVSVPKVAGKLLAQFNKYPPAKR
jgi:lipid-binding SYLF domain-containing protein